VDDHIPALADICSRGRQATEPADVLVIEMNDDRPVRREMALNRVEAGNLGFGSEHELE